MAAKSPKPLRLIVEATSSDGWALVWINSRKYMYYADAAVIHRFRLMSYDHRRPGKALDYIKKFSTGCTKEA